MITGPDSVVLPAALGGDRLDSVRIKQAGRIERLSGGQTRIEGLTRDGFTLAEVKRIINAGAEVEGFEVWFELAGTSVMRAAHPLAPTEDSEGNPITPETWAEYGVVGNSHAAIPIAGKFYRSSAMGVSGEPLPASNWSSWITTPPTGVTVKTVEEFLAIQAAR